MTYGYCVYHEIECNYSGPCRDCPHNTGEDTEWFIQFIQDNEKVDPKSIIIKARKMTEAEAIGWIRALVKTMHEETSGTCPEPKYKDEVYCALEMAIQALSQEASNDVISKQMVLDTISELNAISFYEAQEDSKNCYYEIRNAIKCLHPSIKPQEPKTGHWIKTISENGVTLAVRCSECGFEDNRYMLFKCCPNCKCRMVEPQEREKK